MVTLHNTDEPAQMVLEINLNSANKTCRKEVRALLKEVCHTWNGLILRIPDPDSQALDPSLQGWGVLKTQERIIEEDRARPALRAARRMARRAAQEAKERRESDPAWIARQEKLAEVEFQRFKDGEGD